MIPGFDPKKMQAVMRQMGINQVDIPSKRVIIEKEDGSKLIISDPSVVKIKMQGQESFQISGEVSEDDSFDDKDVLMVMEKTNCTKEEALKALEETGDLAEAILKLS